MTVEQRNRTVDDPSVRIVTAALNRIYRYNSDNEITASERRPKKDVLFHYTTAEGLKGIIEKAELWATSAYFLNDTAEITYGYGVLSASLEDWISKSKLPEGSLSLGLAQDLQRRFGHDLFHRNVIKPIYLACFCEDDNLLSQWRCYGQSGGYSLGFKVVSEGIASGLKPEPCLYTARCMKVEYDREEQIRRCRKILESVLPMFDEAELTSAIREIGPLSAFGYQPISRAVAELLLEEIMAFKNNAFEVEKEWRVVVRTREFFKQGTDDGGHSPVPVHFRSLRGLLTPFVKLIPSDHEAGLPIVSVRSGPARDNIAAKMAVGMLLDKHGHGNVRVYHSDISIAL